MPALSFRLMMIPMNYDAARQEWNTLLNKFPLVIVFAQDTQDVVNAVCWARYWNIPIRMRSGGHSYEGLSSVNSPNLAIKNWPQVYYGCNFERLTQVKARYDPENVFNFPQSVPPGKIIQQPPCRSQI